MRRWTAPEVRVDAGANLTLQSGLIRTPKLGVSQGTFQFLGGKLKLKPSSAISATQLDRPSSGRRRPTSISGNFQQTGGDLTAMINGSILIQDPQVLLR